MAKQSRRAMAKKECLRAKDSLDSLVLHVENLRSAGYEGIDSTWANSFILIREGVLGIDGIIDWWLSHL